MKKIILTLCLFGLVGLQGHEPWIREANRLCTNVSEERFQERKEYFQERFDDCMRRNLRGGREGCEQWACYQDPHNW